MNFPKIFVGGNCPETFISWVQNLDSFIMQNQVSSQERLSLAVSLLRSEARAWWKIEEEARWYDEEPINTWDELKLTMSCRYIPGFQWEEIVPKCDFHLEKTEPPYSQPEESLYMVAAEQEGKTEVVCVHVPDQTKREKGVLKDSSTTAELVYTLVDQISKKLLFKTGSQYYVFKPGGGLDLRTNPLKGGGDDMNLISSKYKVMQVCFRQEDSEAVAQSKRDLIGLIHEVLDRERGTSLVGHVGLLRIGNWAYF